MTWGADKVQEQTAERRKGTWAAPKSGHQMQLGGVSGSPSRLSAPSIGDVHEAKAEGEGGDAALYRWCLLTAADFRLQPQLPQKNPTIDMGITSSTTRTLVERRSKVRSGHSHRAGGATGQPQASHIRSHAAFDAR